LIPIRLHLSGFLSYRDSVDVDFEAFDVACISGQNGAGKSSLLDAITFALFGEARKRDDAIINFACDTAEVKFVFEYEDSVYSVQRTKPKGKNTLLEFAVQAEDGTWKPLTEATLRATDDRIRSTLRLDYETFINASFFLQGKADLFAQQSPGDRKRILSSILGLEIWESYRAEAARRRLESEKRLAVVEAMLVEIETELGEEAARKERLAAVEKGFTSQKALADASKQILDQQRLLQERFAGEQKQVEKQAEELKRQQQEMDEQNSRLLERQQERQKLQAQLGREDEIRRAVVAWENTRGELEKWDALAVNFQKFDKQRSAPLQAIAAEKARLETEVKNLTSVQNNVQAIESALPRVKQEMESLAQTVDGLAAKVKSIQTLQTQLLTLADERGKAKAENDRLTLLGREMNERLASLEEVTSPNCPVCGKPLSEDERKKMIADLLVERETMRASFKENTKTVEDRNRNYSELEKQIEELKDLEYGLKENQRALDSKQHDISSAEKALADWQQGGSLQLAALSKQLEGNDYALEARRQLAGIDAELKTLGYDAAEHERVRQAELNGRGSQQEWLELEKARSALGPLEREVESMHAAIGKQEERIQTLQNELKEAQEKLAGQLRTLPDLALKEREYYDLQESVNKLMQGLAQARNDVAVLGKLKDSQEKQKQEKAAIIDGVAQLKALERAFGKDGIPALLIEQALPEIESNANEILDRLSDGNMSVKFETQREFKDKKREDRKETLDIRIRDSYGGGERDYELFSGGEAFRVNFAIRLALSRVLSRRAGARLRTLVIDEGFGSQDAEGRQRLIEAINMAGGDFAKILVITHMEELKDAFPARIEVTKTPRGSQVEVVAG
jgi:exonuclease SbcC